MARRLSKDLSMEEAALYALEEGLNFTGLAWATGNCGPAEMRSEILARSMKSNAAAEKIVAETREGLTVGDLCVTAHPVTVRAGESFDTDILREFPDGHEMRILSFGADRRMLVRFEDEGLAGWVSFKTKSNVFLLQKKPDLVAAKKGVLERLIGRARN